MADAPLALPAPTHSQAAARTRLPPTIHRTSFSLPRSGRRIPRRSTFSPARRACGGSDPAGAARNARADLRLCILPRDQAACPPPTRIDALLAPAVTDQSAPPSRHPRRSTRDSPLRRLRSKRELSLRRLTLVQGKEPSSQMYSPQSCDDLPSPLDKFLYTPLAEQKHQEQCGSARRLSSLSPAIGVSKVASKRMQASSLQGKLQGFADKRRKVAPVSAAGKPNNKKPVAQQKPKRTPPAVLTAAEKRLDMYRRLPPDQLVVPRRTPYNLIQERYAPDPWKVMAICMLLNRTKGKTIEQFVEGFFTRYPDAQTACNADLAGMVEYLRPTGLQLEKAARIRKFSSSYLSSDWTYVTELHGVGKYAADAYAIFCAGRVMDVQPEDHKLVDYWKYVCNIGEPWDDEDSCFAI